MHRPFDKWLVIGLIVVVTLLLINAGVAYRNTRQLHTDAAAVAHPIQGANSAFCHFSHPNNLYEKYVGNPTFKC